MNCVVLVGRLTRDPDLGRTASGVAVVTFRLAVDRPGEGADFVTVKVWRRLAEVIAEHLRRGRRVAVHGRLEHAEWTDGEGRRLARLRVVADRVEFLDPPARRDRTGEGEGSMRDGSMRDGSPAASAAGR